MDVSSVSAGGENLEQRAQWGQKAARPGVSHSILAAAPEFDASKN